MDILRCKIHHRDIAFEQNFFLVEIRHIFLHHYYKSIVLGLDMDDNSLSQVCQFYTTKYVDYQMFLDYYHSIDINPLEHEITVYNISFFYFVQFE